MVEIFQHKFNGTWFRETGFHGKENPVDIGVELKIEDTYIGVWKIYIAN